MCQEILDPSWGGVVLRMLTLNGCTLACIVFKPSWAQQATMHKPQDWRKRNRQSNFKKSHETQPTAQAASRCMTITFKHLKICDDNPKRWTSRHEQASRSKNCSFISLTAHLLLPHRGPPTLPTYWRNKHTHDRNQHCPAQPWKACHDPGHHNQRASDTLQTGSHTSRRCVAMG